MNKLRYFAVGLAAVVMSLSSFGFANFASAVDDNTPTLVSVVAENTGGSTAKEEGDSLVFTFSESVADFDVTEDNIDNILDLNNSHSFLDGDGNFGSVDWDNDNTELTLELSDSVSLPSVSVGDTVTIDGNDLTDEDDNVFAGLVTITGSFTADSTDDEDSDECTMSASRNGHDDEEDVNEDTNDDTDDDSDCDDSGNDNKVCNNALQNGKLYKIGSEATVYLAVRHCTLKPFRGAAVFHARGHKFTDVIALGSLPAGVTISGEPALPVEGTLVKGTDKTVWFIDHKGKREGFVSSDVFTKLGFKFEHVKEISDSDLNELPKEDSNVSDGSHHPDGSLIKCGNSAAVFLVIGNSRFPFTSAEAFQGRGHSFDHILDVDCGRFVYQESTPITE